MEINKLNDWLTLLANLGVLAGILFLSIELQQANRIATATAEIEIRNSYGDLNSGIYADEALAELLIRGQDDTAEYDAVEDIRHYQWIIQLVNIWLSIEIAYENGIAPLETYNVIFDDMNLTLGVPYSRKQLRLIHSQYPSLAETEVFTHINEQLLLVGE